MNPRRRNWPRALLPAAGACLLLPGCRVLLEPTPHQVPTTSNWVASNVMLDMVAGAMPTPEPAKLEVPSEGVIPAGGTLPLPPLASTPLLPVKYEAPKAKKLELPAGLPGAEATVPSLPAETPQTREERSQAIDRLFPKLPDLGPDPLPSPGGEGLSVEALIEQAKRNSPQIQQAVAEIERNRGQWVQAGLYPNPTIGFQADQIADFGPYGQYGGYVNQNIVTGKKLSLARGVAYFDLINARLQLRRQEIDLAKQVRSDYYAVLVAAESVRVARLLCQFTDEIYRQQVGSVRSGLSAPYDASAARSMAVQSRTTLIQSRNRYTASWKQLAATLNEPETQPTALAGRIEAALPVYSFETLQERMLAGHTDLGIARNQLAQAEQALLLEHKRIIPDVQNYVYLQQDTLAESQRAPSVQVGFMVGVTVPIFNKNQGAIAAAQATLMSRSREVERVRNDLVRNLADAFERYENGRQQLVLYRDMILPDLVRAFRGTFDRYQVEPDKVSYSDIQNAQQNLVDQMTTYLQSLQSQWQAVADLTAVVQAEDPYRLMERLEAVVPECWPTK